jgi:hypothetical protein
MKNLYEGPESFFLPAFPALDFLTVLQRGMLAPSAFDPAEPSTRAQAEGLVAGHLRWLRFPPTAKPKKIKGLTTKLEKTPRPLNLYNS